MFKNMGKFLEKSDKSSKIVYKLPKLKTFRLNPKHWLKAFLRWFKFRDSFDDILVAEDTDINKIIDVWLRSLILWLMTIFVTGFLITIAIIPFYSVPFVIETIMLMFSLGLLYYVILEAIKDIRNAIKKGV